MTRVSIAAARCLLLGLCLLGCSESRDRGSASETVTGEFAIVYHVARDPGGATYAVTPEGLYRLPSGGTRWSDVSPPAFGLATWVEADRLTPGRVYLAGSSWQARGGLRENYVWRSPDQGQTWTRLAVGLPPSWSGPIAGAPSSSFIQPDPTRLDRVWLGVVDAAGGSSALYRSDDGGDTWLLSSYPTSGNPSFMVFHPADPRLHLVGTHRTTDGGATWESVAAGLPAPAAFRVNGVVAAAADPDSFGRFYALSQEGFFESNERVRRLHRLDASTTTWVEVPGLATGVGLTQATTGLAVDPLDSQRFVLATHEGPVLSVDSGAAFSPNRAGLPPAHPAGNLFVHQIRFLASGELLMATSDHLYRSTDRGGTWQQVSSLGLPVTQVLRSR